MKLNKSIARVALAGAVMATGLVGAAASANAQNCPSGYMCGWGDRYYLTSGNGYAYVKAYACRHNLAGITYEGTGRSANDDITSVYNNGVSQNGYYYVDAWYGGSALYIARGTGKDQLNATDPGFDNKITSFKFTGSSTSCT